MKSDKQFAQGIMHVFHSVFFGLANIQKATLVHSSYFGLPRIMWEMKLWERLPPVWTYGREHAGRFVTGLSLVLIVALTYSIVVRRNQAAYW